jgi:flagellar basal body P-ring formation protein FlgA
MNVKTLTRVLILSLGLLLAFAILLATPASADQPADAGLQPLAAVRSAAERALRRQLDPQLAGVQLNAAALDARLRLPACGAALETYAPSPRGSQARALVRVACATGATWSLNVPVDIRREIDVLVLRRAVTRGETLGAGDVTTQKRVVASLSSPFIGRVEQLSGRTTRRALPEGTAVPADALTAALLIHRGQAVTLTANTGGIQVQAPGRALADASTSQRLRVQNLDSLKVVEGIAESEGVVRVSP